MKKMANSKAEKGNNPVAKFRAGAISCAVFDNVGEKDNVKFSFKTIQVQRGYKVDDEWKNEKMNLRKNDIANLQLVLYKAFEEISLNDNSEETRAE
jgi:hypothetical protein